MEISVAENQILRVASDALNAQVIPRGQILRNYHSHLLKAKSANGEKLALKSIKQEYLGEVSQEKGIDAAEKIAHQIRENLLEYYEYLHRAEAPVSSLYRVEVDSADTGIIILEISHDAGKDLRTILEKSLELGRVLIPEVLRSIRGALNNPSLGIDTNPANFCFGENCDDNTLRVCFVDLFPPMFLNKDGVYLAGFPQPECRLSEYTRNRYYSVHGALRILRFNLMRINGQLEEDFFLALQNAFDSRTAKELIDFFATLPEQEAAEFLRNGKKKEVCDLIMERDQFQIDDLREIAFRVIPNNRPRLDELFRLSMMNFLIPEEERARRLREFKYGLISEIWKV